MMYFNSVFTLTSSDTDNPESCHQSWLPYTFQIQQSCLIQSYSCRNLSLLRLSRPFPTGCHLFPLPRESLWRRRRGMISPRVETAVSILELTCLQLLDGQRTAEPGDEYCATFVVLRQDPDLHLCIFLCLKYTNLTLISSVLP